MRSLPLTAMIAMMALLAIAACDLDTYELGGGAIDPTGDGGAVDPTGDGGSGGTPDATGGGGPPDAMACVVTGADDTCNDADDDCDGVVDDLIDKQNDPENCGTCGNRCSVPGAIQECRSGGCVFVTCLPGFVDLDSAVPGCEYQCPVFPPADEDCNGVDEDCDGMVDEAADLPPAPANLCRTQAGTPCAGTVARCQPRGTPPITRWYCDYPAAVEFDPSQPNGIFLEEQRCDGLDGDCDGQPDDSFTDLGQACDDGNLGICRDPGLRACDPADPSRTICDLSAPPGPAGSATAETCNGLDDNCDGMVDNPPTPTTRIDSMTTVALGAGGFLIDTYEASRPDATMSSEGVDTARSCSNPAVLPWRAPTYAAAVAACAAAGKQLCSPAQWLAACEGTAGNTYPYGDDASANACNAEPFDGVPTGSDDDVLVATGDPRLAACVSADGVHDLSGNLKEWTADITGETSDGTDIAVLRGGAYDTPLLGATCAFRSSRAAVTSVLPTIGFRCCAPAP
jgi:hypothetical protein